MKKILMIILFICFIAACNSETIDTPLYATGYFQSGKGYQHWGYGLYNDKANELNIEDVYTRIFTTIESL